MTTAQAWHRFLSAFGLPAYEENSVHRDDNGALPDFPYLTYTYESASFGDPAVPLYADLWYREGSWASANAKAEEISKALGRGGVLLSCDDGAVWVKRGAPFAQSMGDPDDDMIKRKHLVLEVEFLTN